MSSGPAPATPQEFFAGHPLGLAAYDVVLQALAAFDDVSVRTGRSQVSFRRRRGFAYLWLPGRYLAAARAEVVLSLALPRQVGSPRWKQVVQPRPGWWMHHLEVPDLAALDGEVLAWLVEAADAAA